MDAFQTLADPTRRQIMETLRAGEQQVNDIVDALDIHQSGVSRHLRLLLQAGFVQVRPEGQMRLYSLRPEPFRELEAWVASYQQVWDARLTRFGAALEKRRARKKGAEPRIDGERASPGQKGAGMPRTGDARAEPRVDGERAKPAQKENESDE